MDLIFVAQIPDSQDCSDLLRDMYIPLASQATGWVGDDWNIEPLIFELKKFGLVSKDFDRPRKIPVNVELTTDKSDSQVSRYFETFFRTFFASPEFGCSAKADGDILVCFNFMPFDASNSIVDDIVRSFQKTLIEVKSRGDLDLRRLSFVFLIRDSTWFTKSEYFPKDFLSQQEVMARAIAIIDHPRNLIIYEWGSARKLELKAQERIPQPVFASILGSREKKNLDKPLHYSTNRNIGHFILSHSSGAHVRTHYDLSEYVKNHTVKEGIVSEFFEFVAGFKRIKLVLLGLEGGALQSLRESLCSNRDPKSIHLDVITWVATIYTANDILGWRTDSDLILLLTDVVITGATVQDVLVTLREQVGTDFPIKVFCVVKLKNSSVADVEKGDFKSFATINRDFYMDEQTCPMCLLGQPPKEVSGIEDFKSPGEEQPTPLDFWETVADCGALVPGKDYPSGGKLHFRVNTALMVKNYRRWLENLVRSKFLATWKESWLGSIITVDEDYGRDFAYLVQDALISKADDVILIPRDVLGRTATPRLVLNSRLTELNKSVQLVLIVDDGMNKGGTMNQLIDFCLGWKLNVIGALVLDSRLTPEEHQRKAQRLGNKPIVALYTWPAVDLDEL